MPKRSIRMQDVSRETLPPKIVLAITAGFAFSVLSLSFSSAMAESIQTIAEADGASQHATESQKTERRIDRGEGDSAAFGGLDEGLEGGLSTANMSLNLPKLGNFVFAYYARTDMGKDSIHDQNPQATTINRITAGYRISDHQQILGVQEIDISYAHIGSPASANMNDAWVGCMDTKLGMIGEWNITGNLRLYVPNGEQSHFVTKRQGAVAGILLAERSIGRWDFGNYFFSEKHNQTQDSYLVISGNTATPTYNDDAEVDNYFEGDYNLTDLVAAYHAIGIEQIWERPMPEIGIQQNRHLFNETGVRVKVAKNASVAGSFWNDASMVNAKAGAFRMYRDDECGFRLYLSANL